MSKVLIVDDESDYREQLQTVLSWDKHETRTAASGREAIDLGARFRPEILVVDWMLKNHIHGLYVAQVLRILFPELQTILITGFASRDLRGEAADLQIFEFLEKPFELRQIKEVINRAEHAVVPQQPLPIAVFEVDPQGCILYANHHAKSMFAQTPAGADAQNLNELFSLPELPDLDAAAVWWQIVYPGAQQRLTWRVRSQTPRQGGSRLVVLLPAEGPRYLHHQLIAMLLGVEEPKLARWPFPQRVLVVDDQVLYRRFTMAMLQAAGVGCYGVETQAEALRLFEKDEGIGFVILDYDMPDATVVELVRKLKAIRPDVTIVGNSGDERRAEFAALGVTHYLPKLWRLPDLINLLTSDN